MFGNPFGIRAVSTAVRRSTAALLEADIRKAEEVIAADIQLDAAGEGVEEKVFELMARQSPVANELRMLVAALRMVADLERMGDLAAHVSKIARMRYPAPAIPDELHSVITEMGTVAGTMVDAAGDVIKTRDVEEAGGARTATSPDGGGQHQLVIALVVGESGEVERRRREHLGIRLGHPARSVGEVLTVRVLAQSNQEAGDRLLGGRQIDLASTRDDAQTLMLQRVLRESVRFWQSPGTPSMRWSCCSAGA